MSASAVDVGLAEFSALRAEIASHHQAQNGAVVAGLTATAAIGSVAFGGKPDRLPILLILPFVLSGLGLFHLEHGHRIRIAGDYIRENLWPMFKVAVNVASLESWEAFADRLRKTFGWKSAYEPGRV